MIYADNNDSQQVDSHKPDNGSEYGYPPTISWNRVKQDKGSFYIAQYPVRWTAQNA